MYRRKQQGSALMVAIFVITVMAVMAAALVKINWSQSDTTTREVLGTRAWFAANSGIEWGLNRLFPVGNPNMMGECDNSNPSFSNFHSCQVEVSCQAITVGDVIHYHLESSGSCGSGTMQAQRTQEAWAKSLK